MACRVLVLLTPIGDFVLRLGAVAKNRMKKMIKRIPGLFDLACAVRGMLSTLNPAVVRFFKYPPGHYHSPIPRVSDYRRPRGLGLGKTVTSDKSIDLNIEGQLGLLNELVAVCSGVPVACGKSDEWRFRIDNEWFTGIDAFALAAFLLHLRPRHVIEVGSGFSSALMIDINERYLDNKVKFVFIEPNPQRLRRVAGESGVVSFGLVDREVQDVNLDVFDMLSAGDVLFIDSSHVAKVGSDVCHLLFCVLPRLAEGVIVHVHDIPWPFEYPTSWFADGRAWNEVYAVRAFLQFNRSFQVLLFSGYLDACHRDLLEEKLPEWCRHMGDGITNGATSLWLKKCG